MSFDPERFLASWGPEGDPGEALVAADWFLERGDKPLAAAALDRGYGLDPHESGLAARRQKVLDALAIEEHGLRFRYVPAGTFVMGSPDGDPDERPTHPVRLPAYHVADVPITWAAYRQLMGDPLPAEPPKRTPFRAGSNDHIRWTMCDDNVVPRSTSATGWAWSTRDLWPPMRTDAHPSHPDRPEAFDTKPMVGATYDDATALGKALSTPGVTYRLPTEAEWEKAARGGLIGRSWSWGDERPTDDRCDCNHPELMMVRDPRALPANGYGLHGMCGGVWEWTSDPYWSLAYRHGHHGDVAVPDRFPARAIRGGSWADCGYMTRVSARSSTPLAEQGRVTARGQSRTLGFRLFRFST